MGALIKVLGDACTASPSIRAPKVSKSSSTEIQKLVPIHKKRREGEAKAVFLEGR